MREFAPDPRLQIKYFLWTATIAVLCLPAAFLALIPELGLAYLAWFIVAMLLWILPTLALLVPYYRSIHYTLSEDELVVRQGIITKSEKMIPYSKITNVELKRGPFDRLLGIGTLQVHTAGYSQQTNAEAVLGGIADWDAVRREVMARVHAHREEREAPSVVAGGPLPGDAAALLAAQLDELRAIRDALQARRTSE